MTKKPKRIVQTTMEKCRELLARRIYFYRTYSTAICQISDLAHEIPKGSNFLILNAQAA